MSTNLQNIHQRSGRYEPQPSGYRAFIPAPLPPNPPVQMTDDLQTLLSRADRALGRLDGSIQTLPDPDLFVFMYVRREAVLSSQIEGTQSSLQDVLNAEANIFIPNRPRDVHEVINYVNAMNYGLERLHTLPLSIRLIREIHERLMEGARGGRLQPGELRRSQNWIGPAGCTLNEATYVPPPPHAVQNALGELENFLHAPDHLAPLLRIGMAHAQFEAIHPFLDGNGRTGRLLITFFLCQQEILLKPVLCLSVFLKKHRMEYYERLQAIRDTGDWEGWLAFFLRGVAEVSNETVETARRILTLREGHRDIITERFGRSAGNGLRVLERLYLTPILSVADVRNITGTSYTAANQLVARFVDAGILEEATGYQRNRQFRYAPYIRIFSDEPE